MLEGKYSRSFNEVFEQTQARLESIFRMKLVELPAKEKHQTQQQRRSTQNTTRICMNLTLLDAQAKSAPPTKNWILTSTLSKKLQGIDGLVTTEDQSDNTYQGIIAVIASLISVHGGILQEGTSSFRKQS